MPHRQKRRKKARRVGEETRGSGKLKRHLRHLELGSVSEYQNWCRNRGLGAGLLKSPVQMKKERDLATRLRSEAALVSTRRYTRHPQHTITKLYRRELGKGRLGAEYLRKIRSLFEELEEDGPARRSLYELLLQVERYADLFGMEPAVPRFGPIPGNTFIEGLAALARHRHDWIRPLEEWRPSSHNPRRQFGSLARHLLAQYEVPAFMDMAWFRMDDRDTRRQQGWFKHIGMGYNIRTADVPVRLTKMMAHCFLHAPDDLPVEKALRWAQVVGQGGSGSLAQAVIDTRLGACFEDEDFWETVIKFLVNHPMLDPAYVGPIVDYIQNQKYEPQEVVRPGGMVEVLDPSQPNFAVKGRSIDKLIRQVDEWHEQLAREIILTDDENGRVTKAGRRRLVRWESSGIGGLRLTEEKKTGERWRWTIQELLSNRELVAEGRSLNHCVASYSRNCRRGNTSVWSLQVTDAQSQRYPVMTIALDVRRRCVTQVRGKYNALPNGKSRGNKQQRLGEGYRKLLRQSQKIMQRWTQQEGLTMGCQV